jgi:hypothetical protein
MGCEKERLQKEMTMRKVTVEVKVKLVINMDEGLEVSDVIGEMEYDFTANNEGAAHIEDMDILDHEVTDSK